MIGGGHADPDGEQDRGSNERAETGKEQEPLLRRRLRQQNTQEMSQRQCSRSPKIRCGGPRRALVTTKRRQFFAATGDAAKMVRGMARAVTNAVVQHRLPVREAARYSPLRANAVPDSGRNGYAAATARRVGWTSTGYRAGCFDKALSGAGPYSAGKACFSMAETASPPIDFA